MLRHARCLRSTGLSHVLSSSRASLFFGCHVARSNSSPSSSVPSRQPSSAPLRFLHGRRVFSAPANKPDDDATPATATPSSHSNAPSTTSEKEESGAEALSHTAAVLSASSDLIVAPAPLGVLVKEQQSLSRRVGSWWNALKTLFDKLLRKIKRLWKRFIESPHIVHFPHVGYIISACAILVSDILWLRTLMVIANICGITVNLFIFKPTFWTGVYWNLFFISANLIQIIRILLDRRTVELEPEVQRLYDSVFTSYTPSEYRRLMKAAEWRDVDKGEVLMTQGQEIDQVYVISSG